MAAKRYALHFDGYWCAGSVSGLLANSGVYCVYAGTHNIQENTVWLRKLLYVGEVLCFSAAMIAPKADRQRAEAAMIYKHEPPCNVEYIYSFPYEQTTISTSGQNTLLQAHFTVYTTPSVESLLGRAMRGW